MSIIVEIIAGLFAILNILVWSVVLILSFTWFIMWVCDKLTSDEVAEKIKSKQEVKNARLGR